MEEYKAIFTEDDCFSTVKESDIERDKNGNIFERSKKCWKCRTEQDRKAIKRWRNKNNKIKKNNIL